MQPFLYRVISQLQKKTWFVLPALATPWNALRSVYSLYIDYIPLGVRVLEYAALIFERDANAHEAVAKFPIPCS